MNRWFWPWLATMVAVAAATLAAGLLLAWWFS